MKKCFDYVIVGGGSAGCVLANRLSANPAVNVALVEAGRDHKRSWDWWKSSMPAALTFNLANDKYNWDYYTAPQKHLNNRKLHQPRGKMLGGSSGVNAMVYIRGHALDYDGWQEDIDAAGSEMSSEVSWNFKDVLPYFNRAQDHELGSDQFRGSGGPLHVRRGENPRNVLFDAFVEAGQQAGYPYTENMNGYQQEGFGPMDMTVGSNGVRWSTHEAYLLPVMSRPNLQVFTGKQAVSLLWEEDGAAASTPVAKGVRIASKGGASEDIHCEREVILSLGAVGTPQLLQLSGVGDEAALQQAGIPVRCHAPEIGSNLQDHLEFYVQYLCSQPVSLYPIAGWRYPHKKIAAGVQWFLNGSGPCASNQFDTGGFIRTRAGLRNPDFQYHFIPGCVVGQMDFLPQHGYQAHGGTMRPIARGDVKLASADPFAAPVIDPNFLGHEQDVVDMREGLRLTVEILEQKAFDVYRKSRYAPNEQFRLDSDEDCDEWIRNNSHSAYHLSCTAAMGKATRSDGTLIGAEKVRVVDASIMPSVASGNLNAPTIMLAEKLADSVLGNPQLTDDSGKPLWWEPPQWDTKQRTATH